MYKTTIAIVGYSKIRLPNIKIDTRIKLISIKTILFNFSFYYAHYKDTNTKDIGNPLIQNPATFSL